MSQFFDQQAPPARDAAASPVARAAKWLVGGRLACALHLGDGELAYRLNDQGHDVTVAGPDVTVVRNADVHYVRTGESSMPFAGQSFDAVIAPRLDQPLGHLAEIARVLRPDGLVSSIARTDDESIPWLRRLRDIVGKRPMPTPSSDLLEASGLFHEPEVEEVATWEKLDRAGLQQYARATGHEELDDSTIARVHELFSENAGHTGHLRLRQVTRCIRARVDKQSLAQEPPPPDTLLLEFR
ncbi:class I SAM-dependent methyltransferase [Aeromicrobium sp. CTD01-1L150]|uniref:class I SAM-dependent methyltransferase n=1 Tax=Aeromicrobium sp. CTD01-1L150 TaxID=3341830 RepID=UPI0035C24940